LIRFVLLFIVIQAALLLLELLAPVQRAVIDPWTGLLAQASAALMTLFDPDVLAQGRVIHSASTGFGVSIEAGCNAVEASIILIAGVIAFPSAWRLKLAGIAIGVLAVQAVNLLRIISLYYLGKWNTTVFEFAHLYLWQALIMLDVLVVWLLWVRVVARSKVRSLHAG